MPSRDRHVTTLYTREILVPGRLISNYITRIRRQFIYYTCNSIIVAQVIGIAASTKAALLFHDSPLLPPYLESPRSGLTRRANQKCIDPPINPAESSLAEASVVSNSPPMTDYRAVGNDVTLKID